MSIRGIAAVFAVFASASVVLAEEKSWVGKTILVTKPGLKIGHTDKAGKWIIDAELRSIDFQVLAEQGEQIKVRDRGVEGWFNKADTVLLEDAVAYFSASIRKNKKDDYSFFLRARAWSLKNEWRLALEDCDEAIRLNSTVARYRNGRGNCWSENGEYDKAIKEYDEAIQLDPRFARAFLNRSIARFEMRSETGDDDAAIKDIDEAIRLESNDALAFYWRGYVWSAKMDYGRAIRDYDEAVRLEPNNARALNALAWLHAACAEAKYRDGAKAVKLARTACELTAWKDMHYLSTLAAAYAEAGQFDEAVRWQEKALDDKEYANASGEGARQRLQLYRDKKPYRQGISQPCTTVTQP
jgi:tetratricopeptide (TPR) repeat protein